MLLIRKEQLEKLAEHGQNSFENEMVEHLAQFSPPLFKVIKESQMRLAVKHGLKKAEDYKLTLRGPIRLYLEMMLLFGSHFDNDPQYLWAGEILSDRHSVSEMQRGEWLFEKINEYQSKVSGPGGANTRRALEKLAELGKRENITFGANDFEAGFRSEMANIFPEKAEYIGQKQLSALINSARSVARHYQLPPNQGDTIMIVLSYAFGHGCADDPLYPWIGNTLRDDKITTPQARAERLQRKALTWLDHVIKGNLEDTEV